MEALVFYLKKINYKINFERSVSFTNSPILSLIYLESTIIFSPDLSVAVKLISSRTLSIIVLHNTEKNQQNESKQLFDTIIIYDQ